MTYKDTESERKYLRKLYTIYVWKRLVTSPNFTAI